MKRSQDEDNDIPASAESISSKREMFKAVKIRNSNYYNRFFIRNIWCKSIWIKRIFNIFPVVYRIEQSNKYGYLQ